MVNIVFPDDKARKLSFYLAMEEYLAHHSEVPACFFVWQVAPSVIFGRNQFVENEVNLAYCREHGIMVFHRKSGGGCVYADHDNLMLSLVTRQENVGFAFNQYINMAMKLIDFHCIVHGTLLYDTNMEHMAHAITPSPAKLQHNGVQRVRQRVGLLKDYVTMSLEELKAFITAQLCHEEKQLTEADIRGIEELERKYEII